MILYHGTRANPESIRKYGLLVHGHDGSKEETCDRVLTEFGLTREQVPSWVYQGELDYERGRADHSHLCVNRGTASGYADMGGEPAYVIRSHVLLWLNQRRLSALRYWDEKKKRVTWDCRANGKERALRRELNEQAKMKNGHRKYVLTINIDDDDPLLEKDVFEVIGRLREFDNKNGPRHDGKGWLEHFFEGDPFEVRYNGNIPPEWILKIEEVTN